MGIRIQPREIEVPSDDPFKNDLLKRREPIEVLTHLVSALEGPSVLAVDAGWGAGKTTFIRLWAQYLRSNQFPVVEFNAWETDFGGDPFAALSTELTSGLSDQEDKGLKERIADTREKANEVLRRSVPSLVRLATAGVLDIQPLLERELGDLAASVVNDRLSEYDKLRDAVIRFRESLQDMAHKLTESRDDRPLVIFIDELDRCRPSYAVELLEIAKHLFSVDRVVFVLAVNRAQLQHAVKALYGHSFDANGYLRRFFDVDFVLPSPDRGALVDSLLEATGIVEYFERTQDRHFIRDSQELLRKFIGVLEIGVRDILQAVHRLGLVLASLPDNKMAFAPAIVVLLILRMTDERLYHRFVSGDATDIEVADAVFRSPQTTNLRWEPAGCVFEATLILMSRERGRVNGVAPSPLEQKYRAVVQQHEGAVKSDGDHGLDERDVSHAKEVQRIVSWIAQGYVRNYTEVGFQYCVRRLELLSTELVERQV